MNFKVQITVGEISHDDLVSIISGGLTASNYLVIPLNRSLFPNRTDTVYKNSAIYNKYCKEDDCHEDVIARALLNGETFKVLDIEDDSLNVLSYKKIVGAFSKLPHSIAANFLSDNCDYYDYNNLIQIALFGDIVYN